MKKRLIIIFIATIFIFSTWAAENKEKISLHTEAGKLTATFISQKHNPREITHLTIEGNLNESDFLFIKENMPNLHFLDISNTTNTTLPTYVFANNRTMTTIILPNSLTIIPSAAFMNSRIESITIPSMVNTIGDYAFQNCTSLISISLPQSINSIGTYAFENCYSLSSISMGSIITYGDYSFEDCNALKEIRYTCELSDWCKQTFSNLSSNPLYYANNLYINNIHIDTLTIPENIIRIDKYTFAGLNCLSVIIPHTTTSIGNNAFYNCNLLQNIHIGNQVKYIEYNAFERCDALHSITCTSPIPPLSNQTLTSIDPKTCKLTVPEEALVNYFESSTWSPFLSFED